MFVSVAPSQRSGSASGRLIFFWSSMILIGQLSYLSDFGGVSSFCWDNMTMLNIDDDDDEVWWWNDADAMMIVGWILWYWHYKTRGLHSMWLWCRGICRSSLPGIWRRLHMQAFYRGTILSTAVWQLFWCSLGLSHNWGRIQCYCHSEYKTQFIHSFRLFL